MLGFGSSNAFGILFHNFFMEQGSGSGLPLVIGVYNGALSIAGMYILITIAKLMLFRLDAGCFKGHMTRHGISLGRK